MLKAAERGLNKIHIWVAIFCGMLILGIMLLTVVSVVARYVFQSPILGVDEIAAFMLGVTIFMGIGYTSLAGGHVAVDLVVCRTPERFRAKLAIVLAFLSMIYMAVLLWGAWRLTVYAYQIDQRTASLLHLPYLPAYILVTIGLVAAFVHYFIEGFALMKAPRKTTTKPDELKVA